MKAFITLFFLLYWTCISSQYYRFFSRPGGDLFDIVTSSCIQNDTVYALIQSGDFGRPSQTVLHKISVSDGKSVLQNKLENYRGYSQPSNMMIADSILYLAHPLSNSFDYILDRYRLSDLSLISSKIYTISPESRGITDVFLSSINNNIFLAGAENRFSDGTGDIGFVLWLDKETMAVDTMMIYDDKEAFFNGVAQIGTYEDKLIVKHSSGDVSAFRVKVYDNNKQLLSDEKIDLVNSTTVTGGLPSHDIYDNIMVTQSGELLATLTNLGYRKFNLEGKATLEYDAERRYLHRNKFPRMPLETSNGDIILYGSGQIDLNQQEPFVEGQPFIESDYRSAAFASRTRGTETIWDYSYIEFDKYLNNKFYSISRMHETSDGDLFGFGMGSAAMDSFDTIYRRAWGDIWTFRMDADGCIQQDSCGANDVFYYLTKVDTNIETTSTNEILVYPQPASELITIDLQIAKNFRYQLLTISGQLLEEGIGFGRKQIEFVDISPGCYILRISDSTGNLLSSDLVTKI